MAGTSLISFGNTTMNSAPSPGLLVTVALPSCASTTAFTRLKPSEGAEFMVIIPKQTSAALPPSVASNAQSAADSVARS